MVGGMALIAMTLLTPAWVQCRQLNWHRQLMRVQADRLAQQEQAYRQFDQDLESHDPVLLQRLAFSYLHLKPAGTTILTTHVARQDGSDRWWDYPINDRGYKISRLDSAPTMGRAIDTGSTIENWLHVPLPRVGVDYLAMQPLRTTLVRLTTGPAWLLLIGLGVYCLVVGLIRPHEHAALR